MNSLHKISFILVLSLLSAALISCGASEKGSDSPGSASSKEADAKVKAACDTAKAVPANVTGGCNIRLVTPGPCEEIDLSGGKSYEFAWTTDGTDCETPYKLYVGGNPVDTTTGGNLYTWSLSARAGEVSRKGGLTTIKATDLDGLTSDNGIYNWDVFGYYGSHPASQVFRVKK